jgi:hypothetical protein
MVAGFVRIGFGHVVPLFGLAVGAAEVCAAVPDFFGIVLVLVAFESVLD